MQMFRNDEKTDNDFILWQKNFVMQEKINLVLWQKIGHLLNQLSIFHIIDTRNDTMIAKSSKVKNTGQVPQ